LSQEDIDTIRAGYEALNRGDHEAWLEGLHPEVELHEFASSPDAGVFRGHAGVRKWIESVWNVAAEGSRFEPEEFSEAGRFVLVSVHAYVFAGGSSVPVEARIFHLFEVEEGKSRRIWGYLSEDDALEAMRRMD
jgi:ketosteroid isomerase-like protein